MQNRIGTKIYFDYDEIETIRDYPQLMSSIRNYIQKYNQKPDIINFVNNYRVNGPDRRIGNLKERLNCFGQIIDDYHHQYKVTFYVDQPVLNSRENYSASNTYRKVGHSFIGLEKYNSTNNQLVRLVFGFYISGYELTALTNMSVAGAWGDDGGTQYDVSVSKLLTPSQFSNIINTLKSIGDGTAPNYHLVDNNCTTFGYNLLSGYITLPSGRGDIGILGVGINPADMCEDLKGYPHFYPGQFTSGDNLIALSSTNCN